MYCSTSRFDKNRGTGNTLTSHLVYKTMSCDENSFEHNKGTSSSGAGTKNSPLHVSKFDSRRLNQWSWLKTCLSSAFSSEAVLSCEPRQMHEFNHCFVERGVFWLLMFIQNDRVKLLYCFVWNYRKPGIIYLPGMMALNLLLCGFRLFMFCCTRYHGSWADVEETWLKYLSKWILNVGNCL